MDKYEEALERAKKKVEESTAIYGKNCAAVQLIQEVFRELRESEDDRIRKELIDFIQWAEDRGMTRHDYHQAKRPAVWIAYLEKQKEQKPAEDWREERKKECPFRVKLDNNLYGCKQYADVVCACAGNCSWVVGYPKLKEIQDRKEQKPAEWSEEDELTIADLINYFEGDSLECSTEEMVQRIKSLRPSWKPSEEQMSMLLAVINDPNNAGSESCHLALISIYEQLKKLM